jgi:hypothetical protein
LSFQAFDPGNDDFRIDLCHLGLASTSFSGSSRFLNLELEGLRFRPQTRDLGLCRLLLLAKLQEPLGQFGDLRLCDLLIAYEDRNEQEHKQ